MLDYDYVHSEYYDWVLRQLNDSSATTAVDDGLQSKRHVDRTNGQWGP